MDSPIRLPQRQQFGQLDLLVFVGRRQVRRAENRRHDAGEGVAQFWGRAEQLSFPVIISINLN